jgi:hypothetical protein
MMLELRPICEHCAAPLPPESAEARICSFECTFCRPCVEGILQNVCPNCGGGFVPRPIRPKHNWKDENYLGKYPASAQIKRHPVDVQAHIRFAVDIHRVAPENR